MWVLLLLILGLPWLLQALDAWRNWCIVRRECRMIDFEWELYHE